MILEKRRIFYLQTKDRVKDRKLFDTEFMYTYANVEVAIQNERAQASVFLMRIICFACNELFNFASCTKNCNHAEESAPGS